MNNRFLMAASALLLLTACNQGTTTPPPPAQASSPEPATAAAPSAPASAAVSIDAPAGKYLVDRTHAVLGFQVKHLGLSNYFARFTDYDVSVNLDPQSLADSAVAVSIDAASVAADYPGDYKATHQKSKFDSWVEDLARSEKFFNSDEHPKITFQSTSVRDAGDGRLDVVGDLSLLGTTRPVTLQVDVVGSVAEHPFTKSGAIGFSARGSFQRSEFGMTHLVSPPLVGDQVTLIFEGEFNQAKSE